MTWMPLIGKNVEIIDSSNPNLLGKKGKVVDETKNMLIIENSKVIKVAKDSVNLLIDGKIVYGKEIKYRPVDRISRR